MRKAVIDLGTNTFNLLIADVHETSFESLYATKEPVLLGMGGINDNRIADDAIVRALSTIEKFALICDRFEIERKSIVAIGTSALRGASNADVFLEKVQRTFGITVKIVSGKDEAELIYSGVKWTHEINDSAIIMDIGGGSTEFIDVNATGIVHIASLDIGVSRIYQEFDHPVIYPSALQNDIRTCFDQSANQCMTKFTSDTLIGASGSFETFYEMIFQKDWSSNHEVVELPLKELRHELNWAIHSNQTERNEHIWITDIRKTMLPIAALQINWAIEKMSVQKVLVSPHSLKEGALR